MGTSIYIQQPTHLINLINMHSHHLQQKILKDILCVTQHDIILDFFSGHSISFSLNQYCYKKQNIC